MADYTQKTVRRHYNLLLSWQRQIVDLQLQVSEEISTSKSHKQKYAWWWRLNLEAMKGITDTAHYAIDWWIENYKKNNDV